MLYYFLFRNPLVAYCHSISNRHRTRTNLWCAQVACWTSGLGRCGKLSGVSAQGAWRAKAPRASGAHATAPFRRQARYNVMMRPSLLTLMCPLSMSVVRAADNVESSMSYPRLVRSVRIMPSSRPSSSLSLIICNSTAIGIVFTSVGLRLWANGS